MGKPGFLFPGQGTQAVGMGRDLAEAYPMARHTFDEANRELDMELDRLCFEGPAEALSRSDVAQPAILTASVAALRAMAAAAGGMPEPEATAGLSLGEYTALVAAGALDFGQAVRLVQMRGRFMQEACEAHPGAMCSIIGLQDKQVEEACERARGATGKPVWPANYNCPGQLVISGEREAVEAAGRICTEMGARRAMPLNVAGAFHTELMHAAAEKLSPLLAQVELRAPAFPVVANVTGGPVQDPEEIRQLLSRQVTSPVRWTDCMRWFIGRGVSHCFEIGPGRVLQGLLKRTDPSCTCLSVGTADDVRTYATRARPAYGDNY
jgi:[acyl-carrier-protein] S-malonyltransferase